MGMDLTRRELAKLAGTGALMVSATGVGLATTASDAAAQADQTAQPSTPATSAPAAAAAADPAMERADELLRQMTVEEKAMQLSPSIPWACSAPTGRSRASSTPS
ncbi:hypothetical protein [Mesorhizobium sp. AA22]|uniref:hypothetical protein n=1 Tax=Mesorhizobium sp. AA22 TaxID=1854057 RepID=UPI00193FBC4E|nr:hypothetical protein [Mesorhizobium sp. AA22]